jgi:molybdopterin-guanine dinucleotide biosynthesis protein A
MPTGPTDGSDPRHRDRGNGGGRVPVYLLAGGRSRRFGADKARHPVGGEPMLAALARALAPVSFATTVVASAYGEYDDLGLRTIGDVLTGRGPAGGVLTALQDNDAARAVAPARGRWILVSACDWVGVEPGWVASLLSARTPDADAVAFRSAQLEPLFALYRDSAREVLARAIAAGRLRMQDVLGEMRTVALDAPRGWENAVNVNRPIDLE